MKILEHDDILGGDVLLCYVPEYRDKGDLLSSGYAHAAICLDDTSIFEASTAGVKLTTVSSLLEEYAHVAVLRHTETWSPARLEALKKFANAQLDKKFNKQGIKKYEKRKIQNHANVMTDIRKYFDGKLKPLSVDRAVYFCSELVVAAFISVGIIEESAAIIFKPEIFSPEDIAKDKIFGFFIGYLISYESYDIPVEDWFKYSNC
ncbi:hypothetical protein HX870_03185 [Pseudomonas gingeri]|uniref:hypothetical protein n=1 Tax=Pseudomonas gingeri TaxID=117681 RepID=UPI0015A3F062|nr:hypothetical protein [Pseudomonas gingeri]NWA28165.1 hypothetical protein [Pseudomonas gingeri]NWD66624.1 hypothetical protein [Pseudomonas gingeri]